MNLPHRTFAGHDHPQERLPRRAFLGAAAAALGAAPAFSHAEEKPAKKAQIAITLDLEMSRHYPKRGMMEWDYQKGNLDEGTKQYSVKAAHVAADHGGMIHFFCVGRVLEQANVDWLKELAANGHPIGNHTYDHVNVLAKTAVDTQFRFQRSPWLVRGKTAREVIRENISLTNAALEERAGIEANGFRTPGGFADGLTGREDIQQMILELGFDWVSAKYPPHQSGKPGEKPGSEVFADIVRAQQHAQPFIYPSGLIEIPMSPISDVTAFRSHFWKLDDFLKATRHAVEWAIDTGGVFDFLGHPSCMLVEDPGCETIKLICDLVKQAGESAEIVGLDVTARRARLAG